MRTDGLGLTIEKGDRLNLDGSHFKVTSVDRFGKGVFIGLKEIPPKKPVNPKVFKPAFPNAEHRHL